MLEGGSWKPTLSPGNSVQGRPLAIASLQIFPAGADGPTALPRLLSPHWQWPSGGLLPGQPPPLQPASIPRNLEVTENESERCQLQLIEQMTKFSW